MNPDGLNAEDAAVKAEQTLQQLHPVVGHLQAMWSIHKLCANTAALRTLLDNAARAIVQYEHFKEQAKHGLPQAMAEHADFADSFQKLQAAGMQYCLEALPEFLKNIYIELKSLRITAGRRHDSIWAQRLKLKQDTAMGMLQRGIKKGFAPADLVEVTCNLVPFTNEASWILIQAPLEQRRQRARIQRQSIRQAQLVNTITAAKNSLVYLRAHSSEPFDDSIEELARAQSILPVIDRKTKRVFELSQPGQTEWNEFEAEITALNELYEKAHALCRSVSKRQRLLEHNLASIAGHLKWLRQSIDQLAAEARRHALENTEHALVELDSRLRRFESFAAREPYKPWPQPSVINTAFIAMQALARQIESATAVRRGKNTTIEAYLRKRNLRPIDAALQLLPL